MTCLCLYCKSLAYKPASCELGKMRPCVRMPCHVELFTCLAYIVACVHLLQGVVLFKYTSLCNAVHSTIAQHLYVKPRRSGSMCRSSSGVREHLTGGVLHAVFCFSRILCSNQFLFRERVELHAVLRTKVIG